MLKKHLLLASSGIVAGLLLNASAFASFYAGAGLGYQTFYDQNGGTGFGTITNAAANVTALTQTLGVKPEGHGFIGTIFAGYNFMLGGGLNAALELNGEWADANDRYNDTQILALNGVTQTSITNNRTLKQNGSFGVSVRPGYMITPSTNLYVVLGWQGSNFKASDTSTVTTLSSGTSTAVVSSTSKWTNGFRWGLGMQANFNDQWGVRGEVTQTNYQKLNASVVNAAPLGTVTLGSTPVTTDALVSLVWTLGQPMPAPIYSKS